MNQAQALYQLQTVDIAIGEHRSRLAEIDRLLADDALIQAAIQALASEQAALKPWIARSNDLDLEIKALDSKLKEVDERLYSGRVNNPKELQDMQEEIAALKRRRATLEDDLLNAMIEVENHQGCCDEAAARLAELRSHKDVEQADLRRESAVLSNALTALEQQRQQALQPISAGTLERYNELRPVKRGQVVAPMIDNMCKACGTTQTLTIAKQVRVGQDLVYCTSCGRILVFP